MNQLAGEPGRIAADWIGCPFIADATGLGRPVFDMLSQRVQRAEALTISGGLMVNTHGPRKYSVPKADLVAAVQVLVAGHRSKGRWAHLRRRPDLVNATGTAQEDLVLSVAVAA